MQRLRWLRLNRTGIGKLPAEISTLKKLVNLKMINFFNKTIKI
jgi:hypothetical protein